MKVRIASNNVGIDIECENKSDYKKLRDFFDESKQLSKSHSYDYFTATVRVTMLSDNTGKSHIKLSIDVIEYDDNTQD